MRIVLSALLVWWGAAATVLAQVSVEVLLDQQQFLRDETLPVKVRVTNRSGQTLKFGDTPDWLTFSVDGIDGFSVTRQSDPPVTGEFTLESALSATRTVDLTPHFDFSQPGRYAITAIVKIRQWNEELASAPRTFEIVRGTRLWEEPFGVPTSEGPPEARKYTLQQANFLKRLQLYVRVSDVTDTRVFRVLPLGPLVSVSRPEAQVDRQSQLHVLFQTGMKSFTYQTINPDGVVVARQTHEYSTGRPTLKAAADGKIVVVGGARRLASTDIPPSTGVGTMLTNSPAATREPGIKPKDARPEKN